MTSPGGKLTVPVYQLSKLVNKTITLQTIDIESLQNRLLKVCYVPASSAGLLRISFFFSFLFLLMRPLTVLMKQTRQAVCAIKRSIFLDVYTTNIEGWLLNFVYLLVGWHASAVTSPPGDVIFAQLV
jgi:hypothetical protein